MEVSGKLHPPAALSTVM